MEHGPQLYTKHLFARDFFFSGYMNVMPAADKECFFGKILSLPFSLSLSLCVCRDSYKVSEKQKANLSYDSIAASPFLDAALDCVNPN